MSIRSNYVELCGTICKTPRWSETDFSKVILFFLDVPKGADYTRIYCVAFGAVAEKIRPIAKDGTYVEVTGRLNTRTRPGKYGVETRSLQVIIDQLVTYTANDTNYDYEKSYSETMESLAPDATYPWDSI